MVEERVEEVYDDVGYYGYGNPCRYLQEVFRGFLKCLGFENQGGGVKEGGRGGGDDGDDDDGGGVVDDPPSSSDPIMDPIDEPISSTRNVRRRPPSRGPISSGGPGQTN